MSDFKHVPVMFNECMDGLDIKDGGIYFDGTLGGGGHSYGILERCAPNGKLVATDLDTYAIGRARERLEEFNGRFTLVNDNFKNFLTIKEELGIDAHLFNFIKRLCDIVVCSHKKAFLLVLWELFC